MPDDIQPHDPDDNDGFDDESPSLPPELQQMFESLTGGPVPPELAGLMSNLGMDRMDPAVIQQAMQQVQSMMQGGGGGLFAGLFGEGGEPGAVNEGAALTAAREVVTSAAAAGRTRTRSRTAQLERCPRRCGSPPCGWTRRRRCQRIRRGPTRGPL